MDVSGVSSRSAFPRRLLLETGNGSAAAEPAEGGRVRGSYANEANFDTNMVIILAALLCALICALGLNSIVRCALRCSRRLAFETADEAAARMAAKGLRKSALRRIPVVAYGGEGGAAVAAATECAICLGEFAVGEKLRLLPKCNHGFHVRCIDTWLASHSSCPTCRRSLLEQPPSDDGARHPAGNSPTAPRDVTIFVDEDCGERNLYLLNTGGTTCIILVSMLPY